MDYKTLFVINVHHTTLFNLDKGLFWGLCPLGNRLSHGSPFWWGGGLGKGA